jgi:hypothetical protein
MAQPPAYNKSTNFADYAAANPSAPFPAASTDSEFSAVETTLDATLTNLALLQRDDGRIKNQTVHPDSLTPATVAMLGDWNPRGLWTTGTAYAVRDMVEQASASYVCVVAHTAGASFAIDQAAVKWIALDGLNALAASSGSSLVGFIQSGTGAVASTAQAKMREVVSVKDFGAVGDGVADDTAAISNALTYCLANNRPLYFPPGTYLRSSTITLNVAGAAVFGDHWRNTKIKFTAAVNGLVISEKYCNIQGLWFDGNSIGLTGVIFHNGSESNVDRVHSSGWTADGGRVNETFTTPTGNNNLARISRSHFSSNTGKGFTSPSIGSDGNGIEIIQCNMSGNTSHGLLVKGVGWRVIGGIYEGNGGYGIQLSESGDGSATTFGLVLYPWIESNTSGGIRGGGMSLKNRVAFDTNTQTYTAAAGSEDLIETVNNSAGPILQIGDGTDYIGLTVVLAGTRRAQIQALGADTNIPLYLMGKGTGGLHLDPFNLGGVTLGGAANAVITKHLSAAAALDFADTATGAAANLTITVTGAALGDTVTLGIPNGSIVAGAAGFYAWVSAADTVTVRFWNASGGNLNPASGTFRVDVWKH